MIEHFKKFISDYTDTSDGLLEEIFRVTKPKRAKRGEYLLRAGETCRQFALITSGCTRLFYVPVEKEVTVWFGFPDNVGSEIQSFISGEPSKFYIEAIEDTQYLSISKVAFERLLSESPEWQIVVRKIWEETIVNIIDRLTAFQFQTAEQRYLELIQDPDYLQMIPQKYLASYLGITPTSLSRLRKKISL